MKRALTALCLPVLCVTLSASLSAQVASDWKRPERSIRHDIPLTNMIRRAFEAGTRDFTGAPGDDYWQLEVNYSIDVRLDPPSGAVTGRETVEIENNSPDALNAIVLRLDQNLFSPNVARSEAISVITGGSVVSSIAVNGEAIDQKSSVAEEFSC